MEMELVTTWVVKSGGIKLQENVWADFQNLFGENNERILGHPKIRLELVRGIPASTDEIQSQRTFRRAGKVQTLLDLGRIQAMPLPDNCY